MHPPPPPSYLLTPPFSDLDDDLAEVRPLLHVPQRLARLVEGEGVADDGLEAVLGEKAVHVLEHGAAAHEDVLHAQLLGRHRLGLRLAPAAGQQADERDVAAGARGADGLGQRARAAHLQHVVHALASGAREHGLVPVGRLLVVDELVGAERLAPLQLVVVAGGEQHARAGRVGQLQGEDGHAARALRQHRLPGREAALGKQRVPRRQGRARQRGALLVGQVLGQVHQRLGVHHHVLGEHPVHRARAQRAQLRLIRELKVALDAARDSDERLREALAGVYPQAEALVIISQQGTVLDDALLVACGEGALRLSRVQRAGKAAMEAVTAATAPASRFLGEVPADLINWQREDSDSSLTGAWGEDDYQYGRSYGRDWSGWGSGGSRNGSRGAGRAASSPSQRTSKPTATSMPKNNNLNLAVGDRVNHAKYGLGTVIETSGSGKRATVTVDFGSSGKVRLMLIGGVPMEKL